jgi:hypothetical protein
MTYLQDKINTFFKKRHEIFKKPLEKIINIMLNKCKYINGESLERHNWGNNPIKLKNIPKNINLPSFEEDLLNALNLENNETSLLGKDYTGTLSCSNGVDTGTTTFGFSITSLK